MQKVQGWAEQGNTTLAIAGAGGTIARKVQGSYPGATVTVYIDNPPAVAISAIVRAANVVTVTIPAGSNFIAGELVTIAGVADSSFNGTFTIVTSGSTTFTYAQTAANASSSGGTASSNLRLASIYSDNASTAKANPFVSASDATWFFYAPNGAYDVKFSGGSIASPFTTGGLRLFDESILWIDVTAAPYFAKGDGIADDTAAIQAALDAASSSATPVFLPRGTYRISSQLNMYRAGAGFENLALRGAAMGVSTIRFFGSASESAIRTMGAYNMISDLTIENYGPSGWVCGISYDGDVTVSRSTHGRIENVVINGRSLPGDGIDLGRAGLQADMLLIDHVYIVNCTSGNGVATFNGNVLSINLLAPTIAACHIAVNVGTTTNVNVFGGEIDSNDINFVHAAGGALIIDGVRSEGSKRTFWCGAGITQMPVTMRNYQLTSIDTTRPATTGAVQNGQTTLTLSVKGFVSGDSIVIAGAGPASADLHCKITSMSSMTVVTISAAASTTVTTANVTIDATVEQHTLEENAGGPYIHIGCIFSPTSGATAVSANGPQTWIGNTWSQNTTNPYGIAAGATTQPNVTQIDNWYNFAVTPTRMLDTLRGTIRTALTANSATPSVLGLENVSTNNNVPTTITNFADGRLGQRLRVSINDANTTFSTSANLRMPFATLKPLQGTVYEFYYDPSAWFLVCSPTTRSAVIVFNDTPTANAATEGLTLVVTDSNTSVWGAVIAGGGANRVLAYCNGSNWTVAGK